MSKVTKQKGVSSSTPSFLKRWVLSRLMTYLGSEKHLNKVREKHERKRRKEGREHTVEYFHQIDDGYSYLTLQLLSKLADRYDIQLVVHLVPALNDDNFPEPELLIEMARKDAATIAPYYGLTFPDCDELPERELVKLATRVFCQLNNAQILTIGPVISEKLWQGDRRSLDELARQHGICGDKQVSQKLADGAARREDLQHYGSAMFWYEGEWYWGVDRLHHLETRLTSLGCKRDLSLPNVAPKRTIQNVFSEQAKNLTLEFYPSLRSPYTAVAWLPTLRLAEQSGITFKVRPVLPMVMRGVPATIAKAKYIFTDAAREARALGVDYGNFFDPIGQPVMKGYSLYMWALEQGKGNALLGAFLEAAFARGINTCFNSGIRKVVERAGLDWQNASEHLHDTSWETHLESNRLEMYEFGSWGVPSYRLRDASGKTLVSAWGQDRLWLIAQKITEQS